MLFDPVFHVCGRSMEPGYPDGLRVRPARRPPARGDAVVMRSPGEAGRIDLKRLIGLPGEEVGWDGRGAVWINQHPLDEPYARLGPVVPGDEERRAVHLGPEEYFVAGDNRLYSRDSRLDGPVAASAVLGVVRRLGG